MTEELMPFSKSYSFRGFDSGDYESFCFAVPSEDFEAIAGECDQFDLSPFYRGLLKLYPHHMIDLAPGQAYQFKITIEATPIDSATLPPISDKVEAMVKRSIWFRDEEGSTYFDDLEKDEE